MSEPRDFDLQCPVPIGDHPTIQLAHGGGGRVMRDLIERLIVPAFRNQALEARHDSAVVELGGVRLAFTTDSYVVNPLFFPGGDIGKLAVCGTVNDLAMAGARPAYLSCAFILEEGLPLATLERVIASMRAAAAAAGVALVTGDTKVVDRGRGDGLYVNTAGVGLVSAGLDLRPERVQAGDAVLVSGDLGRHGIAVLSVRQGLEFELPIVSDCAPLAGLAAALVEAGIDLHCLRDLTRGGLCAALNEIALDGGVDLEIDEQSVPVDDAVAAACELLGLDPFSVANEGRLVAFVAERDAERALAAMCSRPEAARAAIIGRVIEERRGGGVVALKGRLGGRRLLDLLSGEQLPRIC